MIKLKKGLNLPINGEPEQTVFDANPVKKVALVGPDYAGMKPDLAVSVGDTVKLGQLLFSDKKNPAIRYTAPGAGKVVEINRGEKRVFLSIVIELQGEEELSFQSYDTDQIDSLDRKNITAQLLESGLWTALRSRPFEIVANPDTVPHSIFITAMDSNPLAPDVAKIVRLKSDEFMAGMKIVAKLSDGKLYLCKSKNSDISTCQLGNLKVEEFDGPHPAGNVGTHIHFLDPVSRTKTVWHVTAQDLIAIGHLFLSGRILTERIVSLAGPSVKKPRLIKTRLGASITDLTNNELKDGNQRVVSGSALHGYLANDTLGYLGRYHQQVTVIPEGGV
ncbi:MAG: NADH:ubiquinone reductase (Na(+)-transporting) subunit A, partial [Candidatus Marinimicrobia bacterium]|nr:NADH:ubiquinone reductase (Na(+)-transporting) subunit A [Candidatus Neomarinimicrobiota bacterium]